MLDGSMTFSVDLLDLRLKHTVLSSVSSSAINFWRKKFLQEQIFAGTDFAGTNFCKLAFDCENCENFYLVKISHYTVLVVKLKHLTKKEFSCSYQRPIRCLYNLVS